MGDARDPEAIVALHAEDTKFLIHAGGAEAALGRDAVRDAFTEVLDRWPNFASEIKRTLLAGDHWVLDYDVVSSGGPAGDIRFGAIDIVTVTPEGLVDQKDTYVDIDELNAALGGS